MHARRPLRTLIALAVAAGAWAIAPVAARTAVASTADGPAAAVSGPVTTGTIIEPAAVTTYDLAQYGYVEHEYFVSGTATSYRPTAPLGRDGKWSVAAASTAPYRTRIIVRAPADPKRFNGTVLVEWLNVSVVEAAPDWIYMNPDLMKQGYAWVGVSAQAFGVDGGQALLATSASGGLVRAEPARYGSLEHPGDQYSYDIFSQVARALRGGGAMGGLHPRHLIAVGESQSAIYLTSYLDAVAPRARAFDGYFVHSRGGSPAPLTGTGLFGGAVLLGTRIRDDLTVPVLVFETETDLGPLLHYGPARQPDNAHLRVWEVAGTAHADAYQVGTVTSLLGCTAPINDGPEHFVISAALSDLTRWVGGGAPPPTPAPLRLTRPGSTTLVRDDLGNALGGVRTPAVDTPVATLSGAAPASTATICALFGSATPFDATTLVRLYHDKAGYLADFERSLAGAISRGYLLAADRGALLAQARAVPFPS
ncbi:MAG TPA: alpha/beta hydrolase domain-containing protein [Acidimicrobiales bacterium]|nr:alpha/beta hydrolase domain-containing protein [Acidimicrobiales bacterium]